MRAELKRAARVRRHRRVRKRLLGTAERPRLVVYRSNRHVYAQLVDDVAGHTLASATDLGMATDATKTERAAKAGRRLAELAREAGIERAVFDRGGRLYHGRVRAVAEGAREGGLVI